MTRAELHDSTTAWAGDEIVLKNSNKCMQSFSRFCHTRRVAPVSVVLESCVVEEDGLEMVMNEFWHTDDSVDFLESCGDSLVQSVRKMTFRSHPETHLILCEILPNVATLEIYGGNVDFSDTFADESLNPALRSLVMHDCNTEQHLWNCLPRSLCSVDLSYVAIPDMMSESDEWEVVEEFVELRSVRYTGLYSHHLFERLWRLPAMECARLVLPHLFETARGTPYDASEQTAAYLEIFTHVPQLFDTLTPELAAGLVRLRALELPMSAFKPGSDMLGFRALPALETLAVNIEMTRSKSCRRILDHVVALDCECRVSLMTSYVSLELAMEAVRFAREHPTIPFEFLSTTDD